MTHSNYASQFCQPYFSKLLHVFLCVSKRINCGFCRFLCEYAFSHAFLSLNVISNMNNLNSDAVSHFRIFFHVLISRLWMRMLENTDSLRQLFSTASPKHLTKQAHLCILWIFLVVLNNCKKGARRIFSPSALAQTCLGFMARIIRYNNMGCQEKIIAVYRLLPIPVMSSQFTSRQPPPMNSRTMEFCGIRSGLIGST